jgi:hypothetical protein
VEVVMEDWELKAMADYTNECVAEQEALEKEWAMSNPTGDALVANEKVVEKVAEGLFDYDQRQPFNSNILMYGVKGIVSWKYINNPDVVVPVIAERYRDKARAAIKAYQEAMKEDE